MVENRRLKPTPPEFGAFIRGDSVAIWQRSLASDIWSLVHRKQHRAVPHDAATFRTTKGPCNTSHCARGQIWTWRKSYDKL